MSTTVSEMFGEVREATHSAQLIAFDGCHKIYIAMDTTESAWFRNDGNYKIVEDTPDNMFDQLVKWYDESCPLKFITVVENTAGESVFTSLVPQGAEDSDPWEDEEDDEYSSEA